MRQIYGALVSLYPAKHRAVFGEEMRAAFELAERDCQKAKSARFRFALREMAGLLRGLAAEWLWHFAGRPAATLRLGAAAAFASDMPAEVIAAQERLRFVLGQMEHAIAHHDFVNARRLAYEELEMRRNVHALLRQHGIGEEDAPVS
jgi:hypothetical protein